MRKLFSIVLLGVLFAISSCSKSSTSTSSSGSISFSAGGTAYNYSAPDGMVGTIAGNTNSTNGADPSDSKNKILIQTPLNSGTYSYLSVYGSYPSIALYLNGKNYLSSSSSGPSPGSLVLVTSGNTATATFDGTLYNNGIAGDSLVVTNGKFSGKYIAR